MRAAASPGRATSGPSQPLVLANPLLAAMRGILIVGLTLSAVGPLALLAMGSVSRGWFYPDLLPTELTMEAWREVFRAAGRLARASATSVVLAVSTGVGSAALGMPVGRALARLRGWRRALGAGAAFLPVAAPPVALAVGLQFSFLAFGLGGTLVGVLLAHLIPATGYTALFFLGIFTAFDDSVEEGARTLGATRVQVLARITLPLLRRPLMEAFLLGFLVSWAQVPLTVLVGQGAVPTLPLEVFSYMSAGQDALAATGAVLLTLPGILALGLVGLAIRRTQALAL